MLRVWRNTKMLRPLMLILSVVIAAPIRGAQERPFAPALYSFQNGVRFASADEGARFIKDLGFQGSGSVYPKDLARFKAACEKENLKVSSIYAGG